MKSVTLFFLAIPVYGSIFDVDHSLLRRAAPSQDYLNSMCSPNITNPTVIPPCISIVSIEAGCKPNGTASVDYQASAECLCNAPSTYFADWTACRKCLEVHGGLSEREYNGYLLQASAASSSMCTGTPTTDIAGVFKSAKVTGTPTGATSRTDSFPSDSAVSLYYTPSGKQGLGAISGSATAATASTGSGSASTTLGFTTTGVSTSTGKTSASVGSGSTTSSSKPSTTANHAMMTGAPLGSLGMAVLGGMAFAAGV
ncbi:hypothetical protein BT63DRAFT_428169 [Microthyrium microscopicum]|uniref:Collagen-like protein Mcl1 n=1 Tax=Microthyrium microscopicum TaxID=703497 RepID=A0A6A6U4M4_9PEZI|nr:hypothetical protein BT63DRAFT_428169 [Microthyrium microscopicum]